VIAEMLYFHPKMMLLKKDTSRAGVKFAQMFK